jgi:uncharacterized protein
MGPVSAPSPTDPNPWSQFALRRPGVALALVGVLTALCLTLLVAGRRIEGAPRIRLDTRLELLLPQSDPRLADYRAFSEAFARNDRLAIALLETPRDVLSGEFLARVHAFSEELAALELVEGPRVVSLSHVSYTRSGGGWLEVAPLYRPEKTWEAEPIRKALAGHPLYVDRIVGRDSDAVAFLVPLESSEDTPKNRAKLAGQLEEAFGKFAEAEEKVWLDGVLITRPRILRLIRQDMVRIFPAGAVVLIVVTALWFRDLRATLMTLGVVGGAVLWTLASMALLGIPLSLISASVIPVLLLVAGVGDAVHLLSAYRRARRGGEEPREATATALDHTFGPCLLTSMTSAAGFAALLTSDVPLVAQLGLPAAIGIGLAFVITFLGLPPLLARGWVSAGTQRGAWGEALAGRIEGWVAARPETFVLVGVGVILACAWGAAQVRVESRMLGDFAEDHPLRTTRAHFEERLGGVSAIEVFVRPGPEATWHTGLAEGELPTRYLELDAMEGIAALTSSLRSPEFRARGTLAVLSLSDYLIDMHYVLEDRVAGSRILPPSKAAAAQFLLLYEGASPQDPTTDLLHPDRDRQRVQVRIQNLATPEFFALAEAIEAEARARLPKDLEVRVTGNTFMIQAAHQSLIRNLALGLGIALLAVFSAVLIGTRSLRLACLGLIPNVFPLLLAGAAMAAGGVELRLATSVIFCVVFGIAVDDTIHFLAALKQHEGEGARGQVRAALRGTGSALVATTAILVGGLGTLSLSDVLANRLFGALSALALLGALVADLFFLPALLLWRSGEESPRE